MGGIFWASGPSFETDLTVLLRMRGKLVGLN
jgi:hypothetical protein